MDGLLDEGKLTLVRRALRENHKTLTNAEKNALLETINVVLSDIDISEFDDVELLDEAAKKDYLSKFDPRFNKGFPSDKEAPQIIILKRKAIRVFPDNAKVALYYAQGIDKYISIPFGEIGVGSVNEAVKFKNPNKKNKKDDKDDYKSVYSAARELGQLRGGKRMPSGRIDYTADNRKILKYKKLVKKQEFSTNPLVDIAARGAAKAGGTLGMRFYSRRKAIREEYQLDENPLAILGPIAARVAGSAIGKRVAGSVAGRAMGKLANKARKYFKSRKRNRNRDDEDSTNKSSPKYRQIRKPGGGGYQPGLRASTSNSLDRRTDPLAAQDRAATSSTTYRSALRTSPMWQQQNEDTLLSQLNTIKESVEFTFEDGNVTVTPSMAKNMLNVYNNVNEENKNKIEYMMNESANSLKKFINFASRY
jgi:hypothetical protein